MLQMFSIKLFFIWAPQKCLAYRFNFQWSKQKSFQMKQLIADRSNKTLNAANGNMLINLFKRYIKICNGEFSHHFTEKPSRFMCVLHLILTHVLLFL